MPSLGLGAWDMYGREAEQAVLHALKIGYRLLDTATLYNNEKEIGDSVKKAEYREVKYLSQLRSQIRNKVMIPL